MEICVVIVDNGEGNCRKNRDAHLLWRPLRSHFGKNTRYSVASHFSVISCFDWRNHFYLDNCCSIFGKPPKFFPPVLYLVFFTCHQIFSKPFQCWATDIVRIGIMVGWWHFSHHRPEYNTIESDFYYRFPFWHENQSKGIFQFHSFCSSESPKAN